MEDFMPDNQDRRRASGSEDLSTSAKQDPLEAAANNNHDDLSQPRPSLATQDKRKHRRRPTFKDVPQIHLSAFGGPMYQRNWLGTIVLGIFLGLNSLMIPWLWFMAHWVKKEVDKSLGGRRPMIVFFSLTSIVYVATVMPLVILIRRPEAVYNEAGANQRTTRTLLILAAIFEAVCALITYLSRFEGPAKHSINVMLAIFLGIDLFEGAFITGVGATRGPIAKLCSPFKQAVASPV